MCFFGTMPPYRISFCIIIALQCGLCVAAFADKFDLYQKWSVLKQYLMIGYIFVLIFVASLFITKIWNWTLLTDVGSF